MRTAVVGVTQDDAVGLPEQRLGEAIKQAEIVATTTQLSPRTYRELQAAIEGLEQARTRYERNCEAGRDGDD